MATLNTIYNQNEQAFFKYEGKVYAGKIISIDSTLATFQKEWWVFYNFQTGEDCGIDHIPQEHVFRTREEAEQDAAWQNHRVRFIGYRNR
jgi:hypothetical protein